MSRILLSDNTSAPATPSGTDSMIYPRDGSWYQMGSDGIEHPLGSVVDAGDVAVADVGDHFTSAYVEGVLQELGAAGGGGGGGPAFRVHNLGYAETPSTASAALYIASYFLPVVPNLRVIGAVVRNTVNTIAYTLYLRAQSDATTILASKAFTGNGGPLKVLFDSAVNLTANAAYEIGYSAAAATNMRFLSSGSATGGADMQPYTAFSGVSSTATNGSSSRTNSSTLAVPMRLDYEEY